MDRRRSLVVAVSLLAAPSLLRADAFWTSAVPTGDPTRRDVKIVRIDRAPDGTNPQLVFQVGAQEKLVDFDRVTRIEIDGDTAFNTAEEMFVADQFDRAVDGYQKTLRSTQRPWQRDWATSRLILAASKSNRFDAAASAYVAMLVRDPSAAAKSKPKLPDNPQSTFLDSAIADANGALGAPKLSDASRTALLTFVSELYAAKKDQKGVDTAARQIDEVLAKNPENPQAATALARRRLSDASSLLDSNKFQEAAALIQSNRTAFIEPSQQAEAMLILARAKHGLTKLNGDTLALEDAALAYMRVVAHFKDVPDARLAAAEALYQTATIEQQLGRRAEAAAICRQLSDEFKDQPAIARRATELAGKLQETIEPLRTEAQPQ